MLKKAVVVGAACALSGCAARVDDALDGSRTCTANIVYGIWVHVTDGATGAPLSGMKGEVFSGNYVDTLRDDGAGDGVYTAAPEHPGMFYVHLADPGHVSRTIGDVIVAGGPCHVRPTVLHDTLAPAR